jgi:ubiquinone/menaquinone biosynthesis C-methylase UbiE
LTSARERNRSLFDGAFGAVYSFYMGNRYVARLVARGLWGGDVRPFFASMRAIGAVQPDGLIVDAPCGAGVAFRALDPRQAARYVAIDFSPAMLERARKEAIRRNLGQVELVEGDVTRIPVDDSAADLFLSYWGLHCLDEPEAALDEAARCLKPQGRLEGASFVTGSALRQRLLVHRHRGAFGDVPSALRLQDWLEERFAKVALEVSGPFAYFSAERARL